MAHGAHIVRLKDGRQCEIRDVGPEDVSATIGFVEAVGEESDFLSFGKGEFRVSEEGQEAFIRAFYTGSTGLMLKAVVGGRIAAVLTLLRPQRPRVRHVAELGVSVRKDFWGQGIGRALCAHGFTLARQDGVRKINLKVREDNDRAIRLYESLGFQTEGFSPRAYRFGDTFYGDKLMGLALD